MALAAPLIVYSVVAAMGAKPAHSQDLERTQRALALIQQSANEICQSVPLVTTHQEIRLSGDAEAKLGGLIGKLVGLGIAGATQYQSSHSTNVLQKDLADVIKSTNHCRLEVFNTLVERIRPETIGRQARAGEPSVCAPFSAHGLTFFGPPRESIPIEDVPRVIVPDEFLIYGGAYQADSSHPRPQCRFVSVLLQDARKPQEGWYVARQPMPANENSILMNLALGEIKDAPIVNMYLASSDYAAEIPVKTWFDFPPGRSGPDPIVPLRRRR